MYVVKEQQGRGLGVSLMTTALEWLDRTAATPTCLGVWSQNLVAQKLYRRFGFEKVGEYDFLVGSTVDAEFIFRRPAADGSSPCCGPSK